MNRKPETFTLTIGKERSRVLSVMMTATMKQMPHILQAHPDFELEAMRVLFIEVSNQIHERDWCCDKHACKNKR